MKLPYTEADTGYNPEGVVKCKITGYEETPTKFGPCVRMEFNDGTDTFSLMFSAKLSNKTHLGQVVKAAGFNLKPGEEFDLDQMIGKEVTLVLAVNEDGFSRFVEALIPGQTPF